MIRIVLSADLDTILAARGTAEAIRRRIMRHGQVHVTRDGQQFYFDILVDRDADDLPDAAVTFLRNRAEVIYVAEWDMDQPSEDGVNPRVLKGADPGIHQFAGWPV